MRKRFRVTDLLWYTSCSEAFTHFLQSCSGINQVVAIMMIPRYRPVCMLLWHSFTVRFMMLIYIFLSYLWVNSTVFVIKSKPLRVRTWDILTCLLSAKKKKKTFHMSLIWLIYNWNKILKRCLWLGTCSVAISYTLSSTPPILHFYKEYLDVLAGWFCKVLMRKEMWCSEALSKDQIINSVHHNSVAFLTMLHYRRAWVCVSVWNNESRVRFTTNKKESWYS